MTATPNKSSPPRKDEHPRLFSLTDELRRQLEANDDGFMTAVVKKVIEKAKGGDLAAARFIWERIEGPAKTVGERAHEERWKGIGI